MTVVSPRQTSCSRQTCAAKIAESSVCAARCVGGCCHVVQVTVAGRRGCGHFVVLWRHRGGPHHLSTVHQALCRREPCPYGWSIAGRSWFDIDEFPSRADRSPVILLVAFRGWMRPGALRRIAVESNGHGRANSFVDRSSGARRRSRAPRAHRRMRADGCRHGRGTRGRCRRRG